jgi:hypothetical protein
MENFTQLGSALFDPAAPPKVVALILLAVHATANKSVNHAG